MGLDNSALVYLVEQLPGAENCKYYDFIFHKPTKEPEEVNEFCLCCNYETVFNFSFYMCILYQKAKDCWWEKGIAILIPLGTFFKVVFNI